MNRPIEVPAPKEYPHLHTKPKRKLMEKERLEKVQRENKALFDRVGKIHHRARPEIVASEFAPGVRLDSAQMPLIDCYLSQRSVLRGGAVMKASLNYERRKREAERIAHENKTFLDRIVTQKPILSAGRLEEEHQQAEQYFKMLIQHEVADPGSIPAHGTPTRLAPRPPKAVSPVLGVCTWRRDGPSAPGALTARGAARSKASNRSASPPQHASGAGAGAGASDAPMRPRPPNSARGGARPSVAAPSRAGGRSAMAMRRSNAGPAAGSPRAPTSLKDGAVVHTGGFMLDGKAVTVQVLWSSKPAARLTVMAAEVMSGTVHTCPITDDNLLQMMASTGTLPPGTPATLATNEADQPESWTRVIRSRELCSQLAAGSLQFLRFMAGAQGSQQLRFVHRAPTVTSEVVIQGDASSSPPVVLHGEGFKPEKPVVMTAAEVAGTVRVEPDVLPPSPSSSSSDEHGEDDFMPESEDEGSKAKAGEKDVGVKGKTKKVKKAKKAKKKKEDGGSGSDSGSGSGSDSGSDSDGEGRREGVAAPT